MYRQTAASKPSATTSGPSSATAAGKQQTLGSSSESSPTTIREIRSRAVGASNNSNAARHLLVSRRQATSMERLNSGSGSVVSSLHNSNDREKSSPSSGSSNSLNTSASASPLRGGTSGGLNRTASRVSRFRSAKAVFERLSSTNNSGSAGKLDKPSATEKPRGTVVSRYAAAAAARATSHANATSSSGTTATTSPRSRLPTNSLARSQDSASRSSSNLDLHKSANNSSGNSPRIEASLPKPQPRVIASRTSAQTTSSSNSGSNGPRTRSTTGVSSLPTKATPTTAPPAPPPATATARPPPKDLIDEIVLEIARDVEKQEPDPNCTIQDLSNCDVSGIPETLDFDRCFQDVEMMTEDEARKLLSRKSSTSASSTAKVGLSTLTDPSTSDPVREDPSDQKDLTNECENTENQLIPLEPSKSINLSTNPSDSTPKAKIAAATATETPATNSKCKVRFSEEPVAIFSTHAVEDYDRRNDDIDPIAASAEYEIEKSKEREGIREDSDSEEPALNNEFGAVKTSDYFNQLSPQEAQQQDLLVNNLGNPHGAANSAANSSPLPPLLPGGDSSDQKSDDDEELASKKEYMESLEREVSLKRILEQNLRDLQSQYYEAVKELDEYKGVAETKIADLEQSISNLNSKLEGSQNELTDVREQSNGLDKQLNDIKEFSQTLEKKYHRAKRIIKDMQSREQSFNRREQLYQQKLDEIEHELGVLIDSVDRTIYDDGLKFYSMTDANSCQRVHQAQLDVFGLIRQMLNNFNANQSTQNPQIKQRVVSILEQQLANLMVLTNGTTAVAGNVNPVPPLGIVSGNKTINDNLSSAPIGADDLSNKSHSQTNPSYQLASHRLSQPNLPHPIGVGGQPTKLFHGLNPVVPIPTVSNTVLPNEPSPPQSVNSYPSSNSLNSLNNNNNHSTNNNNNNIIIASKIRNQPSISDLQMNIQSTLSSASTNPISGGEDKFQPAPDIQVPYQTNEWHDKPVSEWTTTQVSTWLLALGLDQYISKFEDRNVNGQSLINLDSTVLKGLGVLNSNDRNLLKKKIRELRVEMEKERKLIEKKMKENLKDKSKSKLNGNNRNENTKNDAQQNKPSWKRGLLS